MLKITVPGGRHWDPIMEQFFYTRETVLTLEHSLVSIKKWEERWKVCYLNKHRKKTDAELIDYIRCMTITQNVNPLVYYALSDDNISDVVKYIQDPHTATYYVDFEQEAESKGELLTAEVLYYYMIKLQIPIEFQKWHLNSLIALLKVFDKKETPPKKLSESEARARHASINERNRALFNTKG